MRKNMTKKKVKFLIQHYLHNILYILGAQLLQKMIASVLKPKSKQKEAFLKVRI